MQLIESVYKLSQGADMVYPYDGRFARVPRKNNFRLLETGLDIGVLQGDYARMNLYESVGGSIFYRKESFIEGGMENENFIAHAPEDAERFDRFNKLGLRVERVVGRIYHLDHYVGQNSSTTRNPHYENNFRELDKIRAFSKDQLIEYINTWDWRHPYTETYYESIIEDAVRSRDVIFKLHQIYSLFVKSEISTRSGTMIVKKDNASIVDIGCGCGEWGKDIEKFGVERYVGVDHNIDKNRLLINQYYDCDLRNVATVTGIGDNFANPFDLCLCLEVAEHLPEEVAPDLVRFLCSLSDYVLFSAAIPYQPGRDHINCQWQTWWERLFNDNGYYASGEPIKDLLKGNENVALWYRQNIVLYSNHFSGKAEDYVDPEMFTNIISSLKQIV
jgi:hypothetical protein